MLKHNLRDLVLGVAWRRNEASQIVPVIYQGQCENCQHKSPITSGGYAAIVLDEPVHAPTRIPMTIVLLFCSSPRVKYPRRSRLHLYSATLAGRWLVVHKYFCKFVWQSLTRSASWADRQRSVACPADRRYPFRNDRGNNEAQCFPWFACGTPGGQPHGHLHRPIGGPIRFVALQGTCKSLPHSEAMPQVRRREWDSPRIAESDSPVPGVRANNHANQFRRDIVGHRGMAYAEA